MDTTTVPIRFIDKTLITVCFVAETLELMNLYHQPQIEISYDPRYRETYMTIAWYELWQAMYMQETIFDQDRACVRVGCTIRVEVSKG